MAKNKLMKYESILHLSNIIISEITSSDPLTIKNRWDKNHFPLEQEITLELGCGKGEYTVGLAKRYPHRNFMGVDIKGARIWHGATKAIKTGITNALFLRIQIEHLLHFFPENSISEIWITFPDPHHKKQNTNSRKRLTSENFLNLYKKILKKNGTIHLKTDNDMLYKYSQKSILENGWNILSETADLYNSELCSDIESIKTNFEKRYLSKGIAIKYIKFSI